MKLQTLWARFPGVQTGVRADDTRGCREALGRSGRARTAVAAHDHRSPRTSADGGGSRERRSLPRVLGPAGLRRHGDAGSLEPLPCPATRFRCVGAF